MFIHLYTSQLGIKDYITKYEYSGIIIEDLGYALDKHP